MPLRSYSTDSEERLTMEGPAVIIIIKLRRPTRGSVQTVHENGVKRNEVGINSENVDRKENEKRERLISFKVKTGE